MKLIIDIPNNLYSDYKYQIKHGIDNPAKRYIANGIPYEEQPTGEWIPVEERLPEEDGDYIVSFIWKDGEEEVGKSWYNTRFGFTYDSVIACDRVIAWMPLPEPYKKGGEEE